MAVAGLGLCLFVLTHAAGNMLLFKSAEAYNRYSHALVTNPLIFVAEAGLLAMFLVHIVFGIAMTIRNRRARPTPYAMNASGAKSTSMTTRTMWIQGLVVLIFVGYHLATFKFGPHYDAVYENVQMRDIFRLVHEVFQNQLYVWWYVFAVALLCFHLSHGFYSSLQTLGLNHPKYTPTVEKISVLYGVVVSAMFISQPVYMLFFYKG
jgi:succinate dehydrogenase / fumarate reductase cytochrome b subunit